MGKKAVLFSGETFGSIWRVQILDVKRILEDMGWSAVVLAPSTTNDEIISEGPDLTLGIDGWGLPPARGRGLPHIAWLVDHPIRVISSDDPRLRAPGTSFACVCPTHLEWIRARGGRGFILPHAVDHERFSPRNGTGGKIILFSNMADWRGMPEEWRARFGKTGELMMTLAGEAHRRFGADLLEMLDGLLDAAGFNLEERQKENLGCIVMREVERYLRLRRKTEVVSALADLGIVVHGPDIWKGLVPDSVEVRGPVSFDEIPAVCSGAVGILNVTPPQTPKGTQERCFIAASMDLPLITDRTELTGEILGDYPAYFDPISLEVPPRPSRRGGRDIVMSGHNLRDRIISTVDRVMDGGR